jgi:hypothetical protein
VEQQWQSGESDGGRRSSYGWWCWLGGGVRFTPLQTKAPNQADTPSMAATASAAASAMYTAARAAAAGTETEDQRRALKEMVSGLVEYACKIACQVGKDADDTAADWVEIYVLSDRLRCVTDYLEIQPSGAVGVVFDLYDAPEAKEVGDLSDRCDAYNEGLGLEFTEHDSDSEADGAEEEDASD